MQTAIHDDREGKVTLTHTGIGAALIVALAEAALAGPIPQEQVEAATARIAEMAQEFVETGEVPGLSIGVVHNDEVIWMKGFGVRKIGSPEAVDADTVFQLASMSKPISATVVAALVSKGIVDWGDRIRDLDPGFALHDPYSTAEVTVRDLFNHRSGLPGSAGNDLEQIGFEPLHGDGAPESGAALDELPRRLFLLERRDYRRRACRDAADRQGLGERGDGGAIHPARHDRVQLPLR